MKLTITKKEATEIVRERFGNVFEGYVVTKIEEDGRSYSPDLCTVTLEREVPTLSDPEPILPPAAPIGLPSETPL